MSTLADAHPAADETPEVDWPIPVPARDRYDPEARLWPVLRAVWRVYQAVCIRSIRVLGRENIVEGPRILVSNHARVTDPFLLPSITGNFRGLTQIESFTIPVFGWLLARSGQIPITPGRGREAMERAREQLARGRTILIYPEGRLSHGREMVRAKTGMARLAYQSGAVILPVAVHVDERDCRTIYGEMYGRPTVGVWQVRGTAWFAFGEPWYPFAGKTSASASDMRRVTEEAMARVRSLLEQARAAAG